MAGLIPNEVIEQIKDANDIVDVIGRYVTLEKRGSNLVGLCPFHQEKTPSFNVHPGKQFFHCFGCHEGGNVITFIQKIERISFLDAVHRLAEAAGIRIPETDDEEYRQRRSRDNRLRGILLKAARYFYGALKSPGGVATCEYLEKRGIGRSTGISFGLGFADDNWDSLTTALLRDNVADNDLIELGLTKRSSIGKLIDVFKNRLMIPIFDYYGRLIAFGGRAMDDSPAKYINSAESVIYSKGRHLFGLNLAKKSQKSPLIVTEGYFDAISLSAAGFTASVAVLGTAMTPEQARLLRLQDKQIVLAFDGDEAGQKAAERSLAVLRNVGVDARVVVFSEQDDPDTYVRTYGAKRFSALLLTAKDELDFRIDRLVKANSQNGRLDRITFQRAAIDLLAAEKNKVLRELKAKTIADKLDITPSTVLEELNRRSRQPVHPKKTVQKQSELPDLAQEVTLMLALAENPKLASDPDFTLERLDLTRRGFGSLYEDIQEAITDGTLNCGTLLQLTDEKRPDLAALLRAGEINDGAQIERDPVRPYKFALMALKLKRYEQEKEALLASLESENDPLRRESLQLLLKDSSDAYNKWRKKRP